jgi:acetyltransferase-like isoleucine patch superfamily enzyme
MIFAAVRRLFGRKQPFTGAVCYTNPQNVTVGSSVAFGGGVILAGAGKIEIGEHAIIATGAILHTSTHDLKRHPVWSARIDRPIRVGRHAWIGAGAIILPGVIVGDHAVVGAGSVVTKHVPARAVVVGSPARIIRWRDPDRLDQPAPDYPIGAIEIKEDFLPASESCREPDTRPAKRD